MAGLQAAARRPTNLAKVNLVRQEPNESPVAFLERLMVAFRQYTPMDPQANESHAAVTLAFMNQAAPDIRRKLQKIERLGEQSLQDLVRAAERVFNHRETPEEREEHVRREEREFRAEENRRNQKELAQIFFAGVEQGANSRRTREVHSKGEGKPARQGLKKDQCAFCKEIGHWKSKCPKRNLRERPTKQEVSSVSSTGAHILYAGEDNDKGGQGPAPLPESWVTIHVEGKPVGFIVDTGAQYSVLNRKDRQMSKKTSWVQGATGTKRYGWTTKCQVNLGAQPVTHSFLVIPECSAPLLGRDLLSKVNAQIHFDHGEIPVLDGTGHPIQVLSLALRDEYRLYQPKPLMAIDPNVQPWVQKYPLAWAETAGVGLAKQRPPIIVKLKSDATPIQVKQYPLSLEAQ